MTARWAARWGHSTVIDARTRAIYVIGGVSGGVIVGRSGATYFNDVLVSTDGGA